MSQVNPQKFAAGAKQKIAQERATSPRHATTFSKGVTLRYAYYDKDKRHIVTVDVTPADCGL